jgi:ubiquinone/menaquinone biosynthesis C-methylase UbiE
MAQAAKASVPKENALGSAVQPLFAALITQTTASAVQLGLFQRLVKGPATARALARTAGAKERGVTMLLDALVATGQLERTDSLYRLPAAMQSVLEVPGVDPETYFADWLEHATALVASWSKLADVIRTGEPVNNIVEPSAAQQFFVSLVRMLFPGNYLTARALFEKTKGRFGRGEVDILDVACGAAPWSMAFAVGNRAARVTAVDFPPVLDVAMEFARIYGVEERFSFLPGDIGEVDLGKGEFDLALLGHICHSEGERRTRRLFRKTYRALKPGGTMAIADFVADDQRRGKDGGGFAILFALNMLVHTPEGATFTYPQYRAWAKEAGYRRSELVAVPAPSPMMLFYK